MASVTGTAAVISRFAAEDPAPKMNSSVMTAETPAPAPFSLLEMLFYSDRSRHRLVIAAGDGMAFFAPAGHVFDVFFVGELCAECAADIFERELLDLLHALGMATLAIRFFTAFLISARRRVADETFRMRGNGQKRRFRIVLVTKFAIEQLAGIGKFVGDVLLVLLRIEESVEIVAPGKITLRRTNGQPIEQPRF